MSLNDKYIINGSTLSDIGGALRNTIGGKTLLKTQYSYYIAGSHSGGQAAITFNADYFGIPEVQKILFEIVENTGDNSNFGRLNGTMLDGKTGQQYIYTVPAVLTGETWQGYGGRYCSTSGSFKVFPLDENNNIITPDQGVIISKNYQNDMQKVQKKYSKQKKFLVSQIPSLINIINQNNLKIGYAWPFYIKSYNDASNASSYNMKNNFNIVDLKQVELLFLHTSSAQWFLLEPSNTKKHEYSTGLSVSNYSSMGRPVTTYEGYLYSPDTSYSGSSEWRTALTKTTYNIFMDPISKRILSTSMYALTAYQNPAIIVYK